MYCMLFLYLIFIKCVCVYICVCVCVYMYMYMYVYVYIYIYFFFFNVIYSCVGKAEFSACVENIISFICLFMVLQYDRISEETSETKLI